MLIGLLNFLFYEVTIHSLCGSFFSIELMYFPYDFICHLLMIFIENVFSQSITWHFIFVFHVILKIFVSRLANLSVFVYVRVCMHVHMKYTQNTYAFHIKILYFSLEIFIYNFLVHSIISRPLYTLQSNHHHKLVTITIIKLNTFTHSPIPPTHFPSGNH